MSLFRELLRAGLWIGLYVLLAIYPLLWLAAAGHGAGFRQELAAALGFLALSVMAMQFVLTARFQWLAPPFGTDLVYAFHRHVTAVAIALAVAHPLVLLGPDLGGMAEWLLVFPAPLEYGLGVVSLWALVVVAVTSWARRALRFPYEAWRRVHGAVAVVAVVAGLWHAIASGGLPSRFTRWLWLAWTLAWVALIVRVRLAKPIALARRPYRVVEARRERGDATTLVLEPAGHEGFRFRAGQFAWLTLGSSPFAAAEHPFSFSGSSQRAPRVELTVRALGDFTRRVQSVEAGAIAYVDGPYGSMSIDAFPDADGYVFVAGGIGAAPCLSMLRTLADRGDRRAHLMIYGTVDLERAPFREELERLARELRLTVVHVLESPPAGWQGEVGLITPALLARHVPRTGRLECFVCGPPRMMDVAERGLVAAGVPIAAVHSERFDLV